MENTQERVLKRKKSTNIDFVNDGLSTHAIRDTIMNIRNYIQKHKNEENIEEKLKADYSFFAQRYPILYNMACDSKEFDFQSLEYFLNMRDNIINNKISSEDASKKVGKDWFDKYVNVPK